MKYKQVIENNKGIYTFLPGYESCDGEQFDPNDSIHTMMEIIVPWLHKACDYFPHPLKYILDIGSGAGSLAFFWRKHQAFPREVFKMNINLLLYLFFFHNNWLFVGDCC